MYSPKIKEDLIPILYRKAQVVGKPMTLFLDDLIRPILIDDEKEDNKSYICLNCRMRVEIVGDNEIGYCDNCESAVYVDCA